MKYKRVRRVVPWCDKCQSEITGNGSIIFPYKCNCGEWVYDPEKNDYVLKNKTNE